MDGIATYAAAISVALVLTTGGVASAQDRSTSDESENQCRAMPDLSSRAQNVAQDTQRATLRPDEIKTAFAERETDPDFVRFRRDIKADARLSDGQIAGLENQIWRYHHDGGVHPRMRKAAQLAARLEGQGQCFAAVLRFVQEAQDAGADRQAALTMSIRALQDENRKRKRTHRSLDQGLLVEAVQIRLQIRLKKWQQSRRRAQARDDVRKHVRTRNVAAARGR